MALNGLVVTYNVFEALRAGRYRRIAENERKTEKANISVARSSLRETGMAVDQQEQVC